MRNHFLFTLCCLLLRFERMSTENASSIAIIGAGFAGLRAARRFEELNVQYTILEGSDRVGGRVYPFAYENGYLQYGAEYVNGVDNEIYDIVKRNQLLSDVDVDEDTYETVVDAKQVNGPLLEIWSNFESQTTAKIEKEASEQKVNNQSVSERIDYYYQDLLHQNSFSPSDIEIFNKLKETFKNQYQLEWSAPVGDLCIRNLVEWDMNSKKEWTLNRFGFKTILDKFIEGVPKEKIRLNAKVVNIDYSGDKVKIQLANEPQPVLFDSVIVTISLGYLKKHQNSLFSPALPSEKITAINRQGFGNNMKIFLEYDRPWWPRGMAGVQIAGNYSQWTQTLTKNLMVFVPSLWAENILVAWVGGDLIGVATMSDNQLITFINDHLERNLRSCHNVTKISRIYRHAWITDEFALGSYSYISESSCGGGSRDISTMAEPILRRGRPVVCFAGEHTDLTMYQTTVGAARSGLREANRLSNYGTTSVLSLKLLFSVIMQLL